jgi:phosphoribosyl-AMP cyclohydrolase
MSTAASEHPADNPGGNLAGTLGGSSAGNPGDSHEGGPADNPAGKSLPPELVFNHAGLIPAIVQQFDSAEVLMLAWMNAESLEKTIADKQTWFWSRSRQELWHKGATSGNTQQVKSISYDCDGDCLLIQVDSIGPACHTGERSCFFREVEVDG